MSGFIDFRDTAVGRELFELGLSEGVSQGLSQGVLTTVQRLAKRRFGELPAALVGKIEALDYLGLEALADALLDLPDLQALEAWVAARAGC